MIRLYTVDDVMAAGPCEEYTRERVTALVGGGITARGIAKLSIPVDDRLWALIAVVLDDSQRRWFACDCAERALVRGRPAAAEAAAKSAWAAAWAAWAVARAAAEAAAEVAWAAAEAAAEDAAWAAEREWQLARAVDYAEGIA